MSTERPEAPPLPTGAFTSLDGEPYYRIAGFDRMPPFLMSIPSDTDLWMFLSSAGGLAAGRVDPDGSLFPYETVDHLHDAHHHTGPITLLRVRHGAGEGVLWQPFAEPAGENQQLERNLYKNVLGNRIVFEEIHHGLQLGFRYRWSAGDEFGWVRTAVVSNLGAAEVSVDVLDGLRNVLPHGAPLALYQQSSSLVDAYKQTDRDPETGLVLFSLTSRITDRPEAAEHLRANVAWTFGLTRPRIALSLDAIAAFRRGEPRVEPPLLTGLRGNVLAHASFTLAPRTQRRWHLVADVGLGHVELGALRARLASGEDLDRIIEESLDRAMENLRRIVASADGLQLTAHAVSTAHHQANVLFNTMRGGVFDHGHDVPAADFATYLHARNRPLAARHEERLRALPATITIRELAAWSAASGDADLERASLEYLPLYFGRRHGDPSRPWNRFRIEVRDETGSRALRYEGNWRDIFQNWEALGLSFPGFLPGMIARFVNASTTDGFNPYRITRDGIDWEVIDPHHPWSGLGYWGDHQIVYLSRLLEAQERFAPGTLAALLDRAIFSYADVPYRLEPYAAIVADPRATITFATDVAARVDARVAALGSDGKLVTDGDGAVLRVNLLEKLLVPVLSKLSNLVPDGGIWMNTQRPEWNDANNALVGDGLSMVTVYQLRRHLGVLDDLLAQRADLSCPVSGAVEVWFRAIGGILIAHRGLLAVPTLDDRDRRLVMDALGRAFETYRTRVDRHGLGAPTLLHSGDVLALCSLAREWIDHAIRANRRPDGLYHAYNLLALSAVGDTGDGAALHRLDVMLEGQVAALGSGLVDPAEAVTLLETMFAGPLYRADQKSLLLYPERALPTFLERNVIPEACVRSVPLLAAFVAAGERSIVARDAQGACRFHADFTNAREVAAALDRLAAQEPWRDAVARDRAAVLDAFEAVFHHHSFTGRSGTMYGYEGLGCIYWHMVAKLLLAVQELVGRANDAGAAPDVRAALREAYERIRGGLGYARTPAEYGAFPTDPYSHTPRHAGAQQPGMTGQVKEEILTRFGELGVRVEGGLVRFAPTMLPAGEYLAEASTFSCIDVAGAANAIAVPAGSLAFTFCQVPVVYEQGEGNGTIRVTMRGGAAEPRPGDRLTIEESQALLGRSGEIVRIDVRVTAPDPQRR